MTNLRSLSTRLISSLLCAGSLALADLVYVSTYEGTVTTLNFTHSAENKQIQHVPPTAVWFVSPDNISWLTLDHENSVLYCLNEGLNTPYGTLKSARTNSDGVLEPLDESRTLSGPVSAAIFGNNRQGLALAHYGGSAVTTWDISNSSQLHMLEDMIFKLSKPGTVPDRQADSHPHEAVLDPTGKFLLVPDLGADLIRTYSFDEDTLALRDLAPLSVTPGSGPRHLAFVVKDEKTYAYLVGELDNTITGFGVTYPGDSIKFTQMFIIPTHGSGETVPTGAAASEIVISPDGNYAIVSSRAENSLSIPNFNSENATEIVSDPLINFSIDAATGRLDRLEIVPAGGRFPRHFSINKAGNVVAVGQQFDGRVVFIERDVETGKLGDFVAYATIPGQVTAVIFDE